MLADYESVINMPALTTFETRAKKMAAPRHNFNYTPTNRLRVTWLRDGEPWQVEKISLVPERNYRKLKVAIEQLTKFAKKVGATLPEVTLHGHGLRAFRCRDIFGREKFTWDYRYFLVTVRGETPRLPGGWRFVSKIEHNKIEGEGWSNILYTAPEFEDIVPSRYRHEAPTCDHCGRARARKNTYVLMNDAGEPIRVGSTCVKDFLGHSNPRDILNMSTHLNDLWGVLGEEDYGEMMGAFMDRRARPEIAADDFLLHVANQVREGGWFSQKAAEAAGHECGTADIAWAQALIVAGISRPPRGWRNPEILPEDHKRAKDALAWVRSIPRDTKNDFLYNLRTVILSGLITERRRRFAACAIMAWDRELAKRAARKQIVNSRHFLKPGDKIGRKLTKKDREAGKKSIAKLSARVLGKRSFDGVFGTTTLITWIVSEGDYAGCVVKWFASGARDDIGVGDEGAIVATVKKNTEFRDIPETQVSRAVWTTLKEAS